MSTNYYSDVTSVPFIRRLALIAGVATIGLPVLAHAADNTQAQIDSLQQQLDALKASQVPASDAPLVTSAELKRYMAGDSSLTWKGITLYGTIDIGMSYQNHGAPLSNAFYTGANEMLQKSSTREEWGVTPSGLSQSKIGLKFDEPVYGDLHVVGKAETGFNPQAGTLADAVKSVQQNNGLPVNQQGANADGGRAGQFLNGEAYVGVQSRTYGRLTVGRHNDLFNDNISAYDPMGGSYAFSPIGYSGFAAGAGNTQDTRLDNSVRYGVTVGPIRFVALAQTPNYATDSLGAYQFDVGTNWGGLSVDAAFSHINDSIHVAPFSGSQYVGNMTLNATVSDTTAEQLLAKYAMGPSTTFGGFQHQMYANPNHPLSAGAADIGGYTLGAVNNTAFSTGNELENIFWTGEKYQITPEWSVTGAYYYVRQNDYSGSGIGWSNTKGNAAGSQHFISAMTDYAFTNRFDVYAGVMYNKYDGGMVNGYQYNNAISPMAGLRFNF